MHPFFMRKIASIYRVFNILSVDVAGGAVICALFFSRLFAVTILPYGLCALGLTVWIIYTADHLNDAKSIRGVASSERHQFHQRNFKFIFICMVLAIVADAVLIFFVRRAVLSWGVVLALVVFIYLIKQHQLKAFKELFVAFLYTCGILVPSLSLTTLPLDKYHLILISQFFIIALINLLVFSSFDKETDKADRQHSFVTVFGEGLTSVCIYGLSLINFLLAIFLCLAGFDYKAIAILSLMTLLQAAIFSFHKLFRHNNIYRLLGDAMFLIPIFYIWRLN